MNQLQEKTNHNFEQQIVKPAEQIEIFSADDVQGTYTSRNPTSKVTVNEKVSALVYPLITCQEISEGDSLVEKFLVRAEYVEQLCNFDENLQVFYRDVSSGLMIDFVALDQFKINVVGVFGRLKNAQNFFAEILDDCSCCEFQQTLEKEGSGMYFIVSKDVADNKTGKCFLYYYSKNDTDYEKADQKSRAVHFFRYITQLTKNIALLFDDNDYQLLANAPANSSVKTPKRVAKKYIIQELDLQKEQVLFDDIGAIEVKTPGDWQIFSSNVGLYLVQEYEKKSREAKVCENEMDQWNRGVFKILQVDRSE